MKVKKKERSKKLRFVASQRRRRPQKKLRPGGMCQWKDFKSYVIYYFYIV